ncbi:hypothetical protein HYPDE_38113 [Hyphomicrobium denitrificans 1NES1]|uniref:Uncharacterized protein n=1 Tax=Hyphomicrobium denitrificans 1NES1 TaxID=670307 RepID=N0B6R0_9HYPH|nr:hypothetical protein HYPDE_38113 [Hyphomicrobium denitrificans 1NES1]
MEHAPVSNFGGGKELGSSKRGAIGPAAHRSSLHRPAEGRADLQAYAVKFARIRCVSRAQRQL